MSEKSVVYKQSRIFYRTMGSGKTVMFIHGFAEDGEIWSNQAEFLKDNFRLIIPDIPGSGRSELVEDAGIETYAEIIKLILDQEVENGSTAREKVTIIGHSMGGYITLAFAERWGQSLNAFGLFHSSAFADDEEKKQVRSKAIEFINNNGAAEFLQTTIPGLFTKDFVEKNADQVKQLVTKGEQFSQAALVQYYRAMIARPDRTEVLRSFPKPILYIIGEHDNAIPLQSSLKQCYIPARSHVHILGQSAHMGMWEEKDKANQILKDFLQGIYAK